MGTMPTSAAKKTLQETQNKKRISWEAFQKKYLTREDGYKYEWLNGIVEKNPYTMDKSQLYILRNLLDLFMMLKFKGKVAQLMPEADLFFLENHRRPDICWLTDEQINRLAKNEYEVPTFVIEVISNKDMMNKVVHKMQDYRAAGVKVVWHILPVYEEVHVYTGEHLERMAVCTDNKECSAAPALPEFTILAKAVFKKGENKE